MPAMSYRRPISSRTASDLVGTGGSQDRRETLRNGAGRRRRGLRCRQDRFADSKERQQGLWPADGGAQEAAAGDMCHSSAPYERRGSYRVREEGGDDVGEGSLAPRG